MVTTARDGSNALKAAVKVAEAACALPAVATQDWCDKAAAAMLHAVGSGVCVILIAQIDERGHIVRQEATGVAGATTMEVTTTVGRTATSSPLVPIDASDAGLTRVRTSLAQARDLHWPLAAISLSSVKIGAADRLGANLTDHHSGLAKRWAECRLHGLALAIAPLGSNGRSLVVELGSTQSPIGDQELACLEAVLPLVARRAIMAVGVNPSDAAHWLTTREQIILQHLLLGKSVREIAEELGRSPHTVHDHVKSLHRKLNASSRGELVARALGYTEMVNSNGHAGDGGATPTIATRTAKPAQTA